MLNSALLAGSWRQFTPEQLRNAFAGFLPANAPPAERAAAIESALQGPSGQWIREEAGRWIVENLVPVPALVPDAHAAWRPPVRDCMLFVVSRLSAARLAPKLVEQLDLPANTPPEKRLLQLIAKVPGLQKLGQVLARNRKLRPSVRHALSQLENGIRDVTAQDMRAIIERELASRVKNFAVRIEPAILSEASVSAVLRFSWTNPESGRRERGVFKVLKPHIPAFFAEDMDILQSLAEHFSSRHQKYGFARYVLPDTFNKVRRLLQHETDFLGEQANLLEAGKLYAGVRGVRVPRVIKPLCTSTITAISEEAGGKVTIAVRHLPAWRRTQVAQQMIHALVAVPLFQPGENSLFHADPHAGNLLYDNDRKELVLLDWALTERLSRDQRRHLALLVLMVGLRDRVGVGQQIAALRDPRVKRSLRQTRLVREIVSEFIDELPLRSIPGAEDAMRLVERLAVHGVRFPAPLIMLSKVLFTLDGILEEIAGSDVSVGPTIARHVVKQVITRRFESGLPLRKIDWATVQCSALLYGSRLWVRWEQELVNRFLSPASGATTPPDSRP